MEKPTVKYQRGTLEKPTVKYRGVLPQAASAEEIMSSIQDRLNVMRSGSASGAGSAADSPAPQTSSVQDRLTKMRASGQPASKTAVPITTDLSGEAWTRATPSQTKVPSTAVSRQSDISRLQEQRRQAAVDMDTDAVARIDKQLELLRLEDGTGFSAGKLAYGTIQQGADRAVTGIVRTAAQYVEKPLMTAVGAVLGDPEMPDRAPLRKLSGWMDSRAEQRQAEYQENADKGGKAAQTINKWGTATAAALPAAIMAVMSGGTSAGAQAISTVGKAGGLASTVKNVVGTMAKDPQYWLSFAQVAGDSYDQAKADGAGDTAANLYGLANGLLNAAVEVGGGIQTLPSELQKGGSALRSWIKSMVDEGKEEVVQGAIERGLQNLTYQKGNPLASVTDQNAVLNPRTALEEFKGGAVVGGILSGGQVLAGKALSSAQSRQNGTLNAAGERTSQSDGNSMGAPQSGAQAVSGGIMEQEVQRLFGQQKAASTGETAVTVESGPSAINERNKANNTLAYTLATNIDSIKDMQPVSRLSGTEMNNRSVKPDQQIRSFFQSLGNKIFRSGLGEVQLNEYGIASMLNHKPLNRSKMLSIAAVPYVIQNGRQVGYSDNWKGRGYASYIFAAPVKVGNDTVYVAAVVDQRPDNKFYLSEMVDSNGNYVRINESPSGNSKSGVTDGAGVPGGDGITTRPEGLSIGSAPSAPKTGTEPALPYVDSTIAQGAENVNVDPLLKMMMGGKRVDQSTLTPEQFDAAVAANEQGTVGMDADRKVYQVDPEQHIDRRTVESVSSRNVNAFQFDHPELHEYYQRAANALIADAELSLQFPVTRRYERTMQGNKVKQSAQASEHLRMAMDETGLSRAELIDAAQRIVDDHGQENVKAAKQVEVILDSMLTNGWSTTMTGETVAPNDAYIREKSRIAGSQPAVQGGEELPMMDDGLGAKTSQFKRGQRVSEAKSVYDEADNATDQQRTYDITSDAERLNTARERLQVDYDGEKQYLQDTPEWSGEDYAVAKLIQSDLRQQAAESGDFTEFRAWSQDVQKHASFFGQDLQSLKMWVEQSADKAVSDAAAVLDAAKEKEASAPVKGKAKITDDVINSALGDIAEFGTRAENLTNAGDAAGLYDLVIELANYRGYKPSKPIQKALQGCTIEQLTDIAWSEISGISIDAIPPSSGQYISTYQYLSHLLNAKTLLRNVTSNSVFSPIESAFTNNIASIVDRLAASVVGGYQGISTAQARTVGMEKGPFSKAGWKGSIEGAKQSAIDVALDINHGNSQNKYEADTNRTFKRHKVKDPLLNLILNTGNNLEGVLGYGLNTTDEFQKGGTAAKVKESLKGILGTDGSRVTPEMAEQFVKNEQLYRSFQRDTAIGNLLQASKDYLNIIGFGTSNGKTKNVAGHTFAVKDFGLGDFINKYSKVPGALVTTVAEYTDLGYAKAIYNLGAMAYTNAQVKSGRGDAQVGGHLGAYSNMTNAEAAVYSQRAFAQNIARVLTGKGLMLACASLAKMGILHFTGDDDRDEATVKAAQGLSGLQINLSALGRLVDGGDGSMQDGDVMLDASSLEPVNALMEGGTRMAELEDDADYSAKMDIITDTIVNSFTDLSMMQSAKDVQNAVTYKRDDETWGDIGKDALLEILLNSVSGFVPGPVRQTANYTDDYYRDTSSDTQTGRIKNSLLSSVPGMRETLPERITPLGEKREKTTDGGLDFFTSFISPFNVTKYKQSSVVDAMNETGVYAPRSAPKNVTADGRTVELNAEQQRQYQADRGTQLILSVTDMLGNTQYKQAGDTQKQELMADAREYANYIAKANIMGKDSAPQWVQKTMDAQRTTGLSAATVIVYRDMLSRENDKGQKTADANSAVRDAIRKDTTLTAAQKSALDDIVISDGVYIPKDLNVDYTNNETFIISQMSDGAQKRYAGIKSQFGMDAETYSKAWAIYQNDDLKADQKRQQLSALGYNGSALYKALGQKLE